MVRSRWGRAVVAATVVVVTVATLGGCAMIEQMTWEKYPADPVLVPIAEKELIGYDQPSTVANGRLQAGALEHAEQTYAVVQPQIEGATGRQVEMTAIRAIYPDGAAQVSFRTVGEPVVAFHTVVALQSDGSVSRSARIEGVDGFDRLTVEALYRMAYREQFDQAREYLAATYPQLTGLPDGYTGSHGRSDPLVDNGFHSAVGADSVAVNAIEDAIYRAYRRDPDRTDEEWRAVFEQEAVDRKIGVGVWAVLADPADEATLELAQEVLLDLRSAPQFTWAASWSVTVYSNLVVRDRDYFHEEWGVGIWDDSGPELEWSVGHYVNGGGGCCDRIGGDGS